MNGRAVYAAVVAVVAGCAVAQEARFLQPAAGSVALGSAVELSVFEGGAERAWPGEAIRYFFARTAWTQENRDTIAAAEGRDAVVSWEADLPGVLLLGVDLAPRIEAVSAESLGAFVARVLPEARRGALGALPEAGQVAVRRVESAKTLVRVTSDGAQPVSIATSKTGQPVEIRPLVDPTVLQPGSDLPVKIYASIPGPDEGLVIGTNTTTGETIAAPTGEEATANLTIPSAGRWRLEFHAVTPIGERDAAWLIHTATLTFDVPSAADGEVTK